MSVKAFAFVPVIETTNLLSADGKIQTKIECIECCGRDLYIGTSDGFLVVYLLEEKQHPSGRMVYSSKRNCDLYMNVKKPVKNIKAASALNRLLVLCNSSLFLLDMTTMEIVGGGPLLQGITTFCVNENPNVDDPFSTQICVADRKRLKIFNVTDKKFNLVADIPVPEAAREIAVDGPFICAALLKQYKVFNFESKTSQELFDFDSESFVPLIRRISKGEFLLTAPGGLGMFVTAQGVTNTPPIQWSCSDFTNGPGIISLAYFHPYILALSYDFVMVHSILDQQQKQVLPFNGALTLGNYDGRLYLSSSSSVFCLCPVPWEKQVQALLADKRVDEALALAENANHSGLTKDQFENIYQNIQKQAAFIYFSFEEFDKAKEMFINSNVDIREVISLFPKLLPQSSKFVRSVPPLHEIADVMQVFGGDEARLQRARSFLRHLLEQLRDSSPRLHHQYEIDTALIKLYSECNRGDLEAFIVAGEIHCDEKDCLTWLETQECYHALALLNRHSRNHEMAFEIWARLITGEIVDDSFQGLEFFVECLANQKDVDLVWRYSDFVLKRNECLGAQVFTHRSAVECDKINPEMIVEFLQPYPQALVIYLEYLVIDQQTMTEQFHTHLAMLYLENILTMKKDIHLDERLVSENRKKFQSLLQQSSLYRVQLLLGKIKDSGLDQETATLYGKVNEHDKALDILVHRLKDYRAAEDYCEVNTRGKDIKAKRKLFHTLLSCYLNPKLESERRDELIGPALELLNRQAFVFNSSKVLEILPPEWSVTVVSSFLRGALRASVHQYRLSKVQSALAKGENVQRRFALYDLQHNSIVIQDTNYCCICKKPFVDGSFARYPNNVITHVACARQSDVCPLTGKIFKSSATFTAR